MEMNEQPQLFCGLDISTQSAKIIIIDFTSKKILYEHSLNYDKDLPKYNTKFGVRQTSEFGVSESDPKMWTESIEILFEKTSKFLAEKMKNIKAISVSGQQHGLVTLDKSGKITRAFSKLWNDFSTEKECETLTEKIGGKKLMVKEVCNSQRTGYTAGKILNFVLNEKDSYEKTDIVFLVHNYINYFLTEGKAVCQEPGDASGTGLWNPERREWSRKLIDLIDLELENKLPKVKDSRELIGNIGKRFCEKYNFSEECKIASGSGDNMMSAIGTGNVEEGIVTISLGTSGTIYCCSKSPVIDPDGELACFCNAHGGYLPLICLSNMANGYNELMIRHSLSYSDFENIILNSNPKSPRVICCWWTGERTPDLPNASPVFFGWGVEDFTKENLCAAVLEGHVFGLFEGFLKIPIKPKEIRLTGGIAKSLAWRKTIANVFNCEVVPLKIGEAAAMGAALHACWSFFKVFNFFNFCK